MQRKAEVWLCPRDGAVLVPSNYMPLPGYMGCPNCGALIVLPDLRDENDLGEFFRAVYDYDEDPHRTSGMIRSSMDNHPGGGGSNGRKHKKNKPKSQPFYLQRFV